MAAKKLTIPIGWRVYSLGVMLLGLVSLVTGDFVLGQTVPRAFPHRTALAYVAGAFTLIASAAIQRRRTASWGAAALTAYYALIVVLLMNGRVLLHHYKQYIAYSGTAEQLAIAAGAVIIYAASSRIGTVNAARLIRAGQIAFGLCCLLFGGAHFAYMNLTAPLIPKWLPPSQLFWAYATGIGFIAAGIAILARIQARFAAILLTVMLASFAVLIHLPTLLANHSSRMNWTEAAVNLAVLGASWVVADSLARPRRNAQGR